MDACDPIRRFSDRADAYERHRPGYPKVLVELARRRLGLGSGQPVVDLGSGTGLLSRLFADAGHPIYGVEPNEAMRRAAERILERVPAFTSVAGRAEATTLPVGAASIFVAGQAFHWFDPVATRQECLRVGGGTASALIVWNLRRLGGTPFLEAYEALLRTWGTDYDDVSRRYADADALAVFFGARWERQVLETCQVLDRDGLAGRLTSSSYVPGPDHPAHREMLAVLDALFEEHAVDGRVRIAYDTEVYTGQLALN